MISILNYRPLVRRRVECAPGQRVVGPIIDQLQLDNWPKLKTRPSRQILIAQWHYHNRVCVHCAAVHPRAPSNVSIGQGAPEVHRVLLTSTGLGYREAN